MTTQYRPAQDVKQPIIENVLQYVELHYTAPISLRDVADALGYSKAHLTDTFRRGMGTPVTAWIIERRIRAALELFRDTDADVATACEAVGFNDLCHFTRQFARHVGMTPGRYRHAQRIERRCSTCEQEEACARNRRYLPIRHERSRQNMGIP